MTVHVRYFASLCDRVGRAEDRLDAADGSDGRRGLGGAASRCYVAAECLGGGEHGICRTGTCGARWRRGGVLPPVTGG